MADQLHGINTDSVRIFRAGHDAGDALDICAESCVHTARRNENLELSVAATLL